MRTDEKARESPLLFFFSMFARDIVKCDTLEVLRGGGKKGSGKATVEAQLKREDRGCYHLFSKDEGEQRQAIVLHQPLIELFFVL